MKATKVKQIEVSEEVGATRTVEEITESIEEVKSIASIAGTTKHGIRFMRLKNIIFLM